MFQELPNSFFVLQKLINKCKMSTRHWRGVQFLKVTRGSQIAVKFSKIGMRWNALAVDKLCHLQL